jgi:hypothetical protein
LGFKASSASNELTSRRSGKQRGTVELAPVDEGRMRVREAANSARRIDRDVGLGGQ